MSSAVEISVVVRAFNAEATISRALVSAVGQTLPQTKYEVLVLDDGSSDHTREVVNNFPQVKLLDFQHQGAIPLMNQGIRNSQAPKLIFLDADDSLEPEILEKLLDEFERDPNIGMALCDYYEVEVAGNKKIVSLQETIYNSVACGILWDKKVFGKVGLYNEALIFPEYDMLIRAMAHFEYNCVNQPLFTYYRHSGSYTADKAKVELGRKQIFELYGQDLPLRSY